MATSNVSDIVECPVCLEGYDFALHEPMRLPACYHSLCKRCVRLMVAHQHLQCPKCKTGNVVPSVETMQCQNIVKELMARGMTAEGAPVAARAVRALEEVFGRCPYELPAIMAVLGPLPPDERQRVVDAAMTQGIMEGITWPVIARAAYDGHLDIVRYLRQSGADVNKSVSRGETVVLAASCAGHLPIVQYLVETCGVDVNTRDTHGWTCVMAASAAGKDEVVTWLIQKGATLHDVSAAGNTAMHYAAYGHLSTVQLLLEAGARWDIANLLGKTPRQRASEGNHHQVVEYLDTWARQHAALSHH